MGRGAVEARLWQGTAHSLARASLRDRSSGKYSQAGWRYLPEHRYRLELVSRCRRQGRALAWLHPLRADHRQPQCRTDHPSQGKGCAEAWVSIGLDVDIPDLDDIEPKPGASGFAPRQAFQFVIFGEKGSLEEVLLPLARYYEADLYLPSGEISDSLLHRIAKDAAKDGRPLVVITISDCDPAGHQMPVSIGRKLQALHDLLFPNLKFEVVPAALTVDQVRDLDLPSTPLKETEKRASRWREAFGVEQTEIDALATLRPDDLREIVDGAFDPYFDRTLKARVDTAERRVARRCRNGDGATDRRRSSFRSPRTGGGPTGRIARGNRPHQ